MNWKLIWQKVRKDIHVKFDFRYTTKYKNLTSTKIKQSNAIKLEPTWNWSNNKDMYSWQFFLRTNVVNCCNARVDRSFKYKLRLRRVWRYQREVIRICKSKKNRQHNGQKKKDKRTNNDLQNIHIKLKIEQHKPH
jgi:hypothetical protein